MDFKGQVHKIHQNPVFLGLGSDSDFAEEMNIAPGTFSNLALPWRKNRGTPATSAGRAAVWMCASLALGPALRQAPAMASPLGADVIGSIDYTNNQTIELVRHDTQTTLGHEL